MIYVPNLEDYKCFVVRNEEVIRAYKEIPTNDSEVEYRDYYYNSNYLYNDGTQSFNQYAILPICLSNDVLTDSIYYRNDFDKILVIFLIMTIFCIFIPLKLFSKLFKKRL